MSGAGAPVTLPSERMRQLQQERSLRGYSQAYLISDIQKTKENNEWLRKEILASRAEMGFLQQFRSSSPLLSQPRSTSPALPLRNSPPRTSPLPHASQRSSRTPSPDLRRGAENGAVQVVEGEPVPPREMRDTDLQTDPEKVERGTPCPQPEEFSSPPFPATDIPPLVAVTLPKAVAVGDAVEVIAIFSDDVYDRRVPEPILSYSWSAARFCDRACDDDLSLAATTRAITVPEGCAGKYLKVSVTCDSDKTMELTASTEELVAYRVPVISIAEILRLPSASERETEPDTFVPMPGERITFRYSLASDVPEGPPQVKWFRRGLEDLESRDKVEYTVKDSDVGEEIKLQLTPVAPDGATGTPILTSSSRVAKPIPVVTRVDITGELAVGGRLQAVASGRLLHLADMIFEWAVLLPNDGRDPTCTRRDRGEVIEIMPSDAGCMFAVLAQGSFRGTALEPVECCTLPVEKHPEIVGDLAVGATLSVDGGMPGMRVRWLCGSEAQGWKPRGEGRSVTVSSADVGKVFCAECQWTDARGRDRDATLSTDPIPSQTTLKPTLVGHPEIIGEVRAGAMLTCQATPSFGRCEVVWARIAKDIAAPEDEIGTGTSITLTSDDVGFYIQAAVTPVSENGVRGELYLITTSTSVAPSSVSSTPLAGSLVVQRVPSSIGSISVKYRDDQWLPTLVAIWAREWLISDNAFSNKAIDSEDIFRVSVDDLLTTVRAHNKVGEPLGTFNVMLEPNLAEMVREAVMDGVVGYRVVLYGQNGQLLLTRRGIKIHFGDSDNPKYQVPWSNQVDIYAPADRDDRTSCTLKSPTQLLPFTVVKPEQRDLLICTARVMQGLSVPCTPSGAPNLVPPELRKAWAKGKTCGRRRDPRAAEVLRGFLHGPVPPAAFKPLPVLKGTPQWRSWQALCAVLRAE